MKDRIDKFVRNHNIDTSDISYVKSMFLSGADESYILSMLDIKKKDGQKIESGRKVMTVCPRCKGPMSPVELMEGRRAMYCSNDRVTVPIPVE